MGRESLRAVEVWPQPDLRRQQAELLSAMLLTVGERGYGESSVQAVLERAGASRDRFYRHFKNKQACFEFAYEAELEGLHGRLQAVAMGCPSWREGLRAGLAELLDRVAAEPLRARALLVEAIGAGPALAARHEEYVGRFAQLLDRARAESGARRSATPRTAELLVGAIEGALRRLALSGAAPQAESLLPGLAYLVVLNYFGEEAARQELAAAAHRR